MEGIFLNRRHQRKREHEIFLELIFYVSNPELHVAGDDADWVRDVNEDLVGNFPTEDTSCLGM